MKPWPSGRAPRHGDELPQLELDCMRALWRESPATIAAIRRRLESEGRPLAHTTVLTVLHRLVRKAMVERRRRGRAFIFTARISREEMQRRALERLLRNYFDSGEELLRLLNGDGPAAAASKTASDRREAIAADAIAADAIAADANTADAIETRLL